MKVSSSNGASASVELNLNREGERSAVLCPRVQPFSDKVDTLAEATLISTSI